MTSRLNAANIAMLPENWQIIGLPRNSSTTANQVKKKWMKLGLSGRYRHPNKLTVLGPGIAPTTFAEQQALFQRLGQAYNRVTRNVKSGLISQLGHAAPRGPSPPRPRGPSPPRPRGPSPPRPRGPSPPRPRGPRMHHPPPRPQRRSFRNIARNTAHAARTAARRAAGNTARAARTAARRAGNAARVARTAARRARNVASRLAGRASVAASTAARMGARAGVATARRTRNYVQPHAIRAHNTAARAALRAIERYEKQRSFRSQSAINNALLRRDVEQARQKAAREYQNFWRSSFDAQWEPVPGTTNRVRPRYGYRY